VGASGAGGDPLKKNAIGPGQHAPSVRISVASGLGAGVQLGNYRLIQPLGEGAFAEVWQAMEVGDESFHRRLALKVLKPQETREDTLRSLIDEARVCGHLNHPHIVDVYGVHEHDGMTFIAMEFVPGVTLEALLKRLTDAGLQLPLSVLVDIAMQVAEALDHAHNATDHDGAPLNLIHRDLKPGNILLAPRLGAKVTDFGLAKAAISSRTTQVGILRGTPSYIAPEVWAGRRDFTPAVDMFALGAIIVEMATGDLLFQGDVPMIVGQALNGSPEADVARLRDLHPELVPIVLAMLQRDPAQRVQTASVVVDALRAVREGLDAPGGLEFFVDLLSQPATSWPVDREVKDERWSRLLSLEMAKESGETSTLDGIFVDFDDVPPMESNELNATVPMTPGGLASTSGPLELHPTSPGATMPATGDRRLVGMVVVAMVLLWLALALVWLVDRGERQDAVASAPPPPAELPVTVAPAAEPAEEPLTEPATVAAAEVEPTAPAAEPTPAPRAATPATIAAAPAATPRPRSTPAPAVAPSEPPVLEAQPVATPPPAPPAGPGCVVFKSSPPGARVWLGGAETGLMAGSGSAVRKSMDGGRYTVGMGIDGPELSTTVTVEPDVVTEVRCDLLGGSGCTSQVTARACD